MGTNWAGHLHVLSSSLTKEKPAVLVFIHGMWGIPEQFEDWMRYATEWGWESYAVRHRHRRSVGETTLENLADDVGEVVHHILGSIRNVVLIGHSRGGLVAQHVVLANNISAMVLVNSAGSGPTGLTLPLLLRAWKYLPAMAFSRPFKPSFEDAREVLFNRMSEQEVRRAYEQFIVEDSGLCARQILLGGSALYRRIPTLVVASGMDRVIPPRVVRHLVRKYRADHTYRPPHGHYPMLESGSLMTLLEILHWLEKTLGA